MLCKDYWVLTKLNSAASINIWCVKAVENSLRLALIRTSHDQHVVSFETSKRINERLIKKIPTTYEHDLVTLELLILKELPMRRNYFASHPTCRISQSMQSECFDRETFLFSEALRFAWLRSLKSSASFQKRFLERNTHPACWKRNSQWKNVEGV